MNYDLRFEEIKTTLKEKKSLLLQSCCAPCSSAVLERLENYFTITLFYYNPNISSKEEYQKRYTELVRFVKKIDKGRNITVIDGGYEKKVFDTCVQGLEDIPEGGERCFRCYQLRLLKTALYAKEHHFDFFGTTLTVSPYKNSKKLNEIGKELEEKYQVSYLYSDFKKREGYKRSIFLSKQYQLYRQDYCGCIYSKKEQDKKRANSSLSL